MTENSHENHVLFTELPANSGHIGMITLNRPSALNALTIEMCIAIDNKLVEWQARDEISIVIIQGNGERGFCAGGDVKKLYEVGRKNHAVSLQFFQREYQMNRRIYHFHKPYIALLHGITMGGGLGVSVHGSHRIAAGNLKIAMPETGIGLFPDVGGTYFLSRCPGAIGVYLGLTGNIIDIDSAIFAGLVQQRVEINDFAKLIIELQAINDSKNLAKSITAALINYAKPASTSFLESNIAKINRHFSLPTVIAIMDSLAGDDSDFTKAALETLKSKSPTSLILTLTALQKAKSMNFDRCMDMEYQLAAYLTQQPDFYEGVRAALVDKDKKPHWRPQHLTEVKPFNLVF